MPAGKRELIEPHPGDRRYVRRDDAGRLDDVVDVGRSLGQDLQKEAQAISHRGQGDRGDRTEPGNPAEPTEPRGRKNGTSRGRSR
jgi:hypothetical protein